RPPRGYLALEPADRIRDRAGGIREAPGSAARVAVATGGADRRVAEAYDKTRVVAAGAIEADLRARVACGRTDQKAGRGEIPHSRNANAAWVAAGSPRGSEPRVPMAHEFYDRERHPTHRGPPTDMEEEPFRQIDSAG